MTTTIGIDQQQLAYGGPVGRAQFVMGPESMIEWVVGRDWASYAIDGLVLACAPELAVQQSQDRDGGRWMLLGRAVTTNSVDRAVETELADTATTEVARLTLAWSGRWLLIGEQCVISDAGALLGCYWTSTPADDPLLSSSIAILGQVLGRSPQPVDAPRLRPTYIGAHIPPSTGLPDVRKIVPGQVLQWRTGDVGQGPIARTAVSHISTDQRITRFGERLQRAVVRLAVPDGTTWVTLTAGNDSRLTLAAAVHAGLDVRAVTISYAGISVADRDIPALLARAVGVPHDYVTPPHRAIRDLRVAWDRHTGLASQEIDRHFYALGQYRFLSEGDILLRSGCLEIGSGSHVEDLLDLEGGARPPAPAVIADRLGAMRTPQLLAELAEWSRWLDATAEADGRDWRLRLYWEGRVGGWLSSTEQGLDLMPGASLHAANCSALHAEALELPLELRLAREHQSELVRRWAPALAGHPYNPPETFAWRLTRRLRFIGRRLFAPPRT